MTVVLLTTNLARGGAETQVAQLAIELRRRDWDVNVVSLLPPSAFAEALAQAGTPVWTSGLSRLPFLLARLRPQILHCHMFHANLSGRLLRLVCPFPVVISTLHSAAESSRRSRAIRHRDLAYRLTSGLADMTVAVSHAVAERHVSAKAVPAGRLRVIPNGVDTNLFRPASQVRESGPFVWLAVGRLMWKKDYPTLLAAFHELGRGVLRIAGGGPDEAALRRLAPPGVEFLGERADVAELMRAADAFVMSSVVEGFPIALLEGLASGLPCVATDVGGIRELSTTLVVPPRDPAALAAAMRSIMEMSPGERRRSGEAGRADVRTRFDFAVVASHWEALYRELWT